MVVIVQLLKKLDLIIKNLNLIILFSKYLTIYLSLNMIRMIHKIKIYLNYHHTKYYIKINVNSLKMVQYILDNGKMEKDKVRELKYGKKDHSMKGIGKMIKQMVKVDWFIKMGTYMKEIGSMIRLTDMVFINIQTESFIKVNGKMINNTETELKHGLINLDFKDII